ncbi:zinc finger, CCHC-type containing protein [Tanacetum coccineum]
MHPFNPSCEITNSSIRIFPRVKFSPYDPIIHHSGHDIMRGVKVSSSLVGRVSKYSTVGSSVTTPSPSLGHSFRGSSSSRMISLNITSPSSPLDSRQILRWRIKEPILAIQASNSAFVPVLWRWKLMDQVEHCGSSVGKPGHLKKDCKGGKVSNKANGTVDGSTNSLKGATVHVCKDRCWFKTYESLNDRSILHMGNESTALVHGRGCIDLRLNIVNDNIALAFMSTSKLNDSILGHARLGHVHFKRMQDMSKDGLIPVFDMDTEKCKTCMLNKITKKPFQNVKRKTKVLELIHSDLCDLHATPSLGNKNFVTVVRIPDPKLKTLGERGIECIFVGYAKHSKAFRFYVIEPNDSISINSIIESRDTIFDEKTRIDSHQSLDQVLGFLMELKTLMDIDFWKEAINDKMDSIIGNNTWVLADLPPRCKPLGCEWIFKRKLKVDLTKEFLSSRFYMKDMGEADVVSYGYSEKLSNIAFVVGKLRRYTSNPDTQHCQAIQQVLKYLKNTMDYILTYTGYPSVLEGYTDAS